MRLAHFGRNWRAACHRSPLRPYRLQRSLPLFPASARRQSTIQYMNSIEELTQRRGTLRAAAPAGNERRTEVGNGVYTQNVSASRSFRLPRTVYLDRSSAFATVIPAMVSHKCKALAQMHRYTMRDPNRPNRLLLRPKETMLVLSMAFATLAGRPLRKTCRKAISPRHRLSFLPTQR